VVICLEQGANDLHMVQLMPLPPHTIFCFIKIQNGLPFWYLCTQFAFYALMLLVGQQEAHPVCGPVKN